MEKTVNRNSTARTNHYGTVPKEQIQRAKFPMPQTRKQAFNASDIIPIMVEPTLPGDVWRHREHIMARLATPIAPVVDDLYLETYYFYLPNRILWPTQSNSNGDQEGWETFITGWSNKSVSEITNLMIQPTTTGGDPAVLAGSVLDHMGIPPNTYEAPLNLTAFPLLGYLKIYNEWFRDQNLQEQWEWPNTNPIPTWQIEKTDTATQWDQMPLRANKRHDYFTASLPWPQKGTPVSMPIGTTAPVIPTGDAIPTWRNGISITDYSLESTSGSDNTTWGGPGVVPTGALMRWQDTKLVADLAAATSATINAFRVAITTQQFLELDARGGSRYVENHMAHWGVRVPDYTITRPVYLGGSKIPITVNPIAQTAADNNPEAPIQETALGNLAAEMHASGSKKTFTHSCDEHGYIIGVCVVRATPTYQQGIRRHWIGRNTRLDYPDPLFANIGEQAVQTLEIFTPADLAPTNAIWGYQERYGEMRVIPNEITGVLRSTYAAPMDWWHYAEEFATEPALNEDFITDKTKETLERSLAIDSANNWGAQIIMDIYHDSEVARLLPAYGVPGLARF